MMRCTHRMRFLLLVVPLVVPALRAVGDPAQPTVPSPRPKAIPLRFDELLEPSPRELIPSKKLLSLNGKRVRMLGYMAQTEEPVAGGFYLCRRPTQTAEGGAGTGDLPPDAVRVILPGDGARRLRFTPRTLAVEGTLQVGRHVEVDGQVSFLRLVIASHSDLSPSPSPTRGGVPNRGRQLHSSIHAKQAARPH